MLSRDASALSCSLTHANTAACYELFTLRGELRKNNTLATLIISTGKLRTAARMDFNGDLNAPLTTCDPPNGCLSPLLNTPTAVSLRMTPAATWAIIEKLGELPAPPQCRRAAEYLPECSVICNWRELREFVVNNHPLRMLDEIESMATVPTALETNAKKAKRLQITS